ncbi:hypothetical protein NQ318_010387, partial [Aromia moschata]
FVFWDIAYFMVISFVSSMATTIVVTCVEVQLSCKRKENVNEECYKTIKTSGPYHIVFRKNSKEIDRLCVSNCSQYEGYRTFFTRCVPNKSKIVVNTFFSKTGLKKFLQPFREVSEDFYLCWREICYLCLISLAFSILILILFRYLVGLVVWIVLIGAILACTGGTIFLWILWKKSKDDNNTIPLDLLPDVDSRKTEAYLGFAILATITTIVVVLIIVVMRKRIKLVVQLFEESGKAISVMPSLLFEPILTKPCNLFSFIWWPKHNADFFRNKSKLDSPITHSAYNLTRYHLGSVALGSFLIATVQFARVILKLVEKQLKNRQGKCVECVLKCCQCCLYCFEKIIKYLSRNAYIEVAIYGYSFCQAGKQAFKLLSSNVLRVAAINSVGDFVLFLGKVLVVAATVLIGIKMLQNKDGVQHIWVPVTLAGLFAYFVAHCFITVYEMAIDTIFLCFCEDCERNDGISKPYYMSRGLMEFVENSKKALEIHDAGNGNRIAWQGDISTISN